MNTIVVLHKLSYQSLSLLLWLLVVLHHAI